MFFTKMLIFVFLLETSIVYQSSTNAQDVDSLLPSINECGVLNEDYLYNEKQIAAIDEFPWIGRIAYTGRPDDPTVYHCLAILISKRYAVTLSHCILSIGYIEPKYVLLGDWNTTSDIDCDESGRCSPPPLKYEVEEIAIHPNFNGKPGSYDVAVIRFNRDVNFTDYIRPICLPPDNVSNGDFVAQHAIYAGFNIKEELSEKIKTFAHIISPDRCKNIYMSRLDIQDSGLICATYRGNIDFMSGSVLMNVHVENFKPKRFYLIGLLSAGANPHLPLYPDVFIGISYVMDFIKNNIVD